MIATLASLFSVSAILANTVSAAPLAHGRESFVKLAARGKDNWWSGLEPYDTYHARYLSFKCQNYHNTDYFTACCNPLLKDQSVDSLSSQCQVGGLVTSSSSEYVAPSSSSEYVAPWTSSSEYVAPTTSSEYVAPTTSSEYVAPTTISEYVAPTTTSEYVAPTTTAAVVEATAYVAPSTSGSFSGSGTYFYQNGVAGACGTVHGDYDKVVALETSMYAGGSNCGKYITLYRNGQSVTAMVADECPTCVSSTSVDMSVGAFTELGTEAEGMFDITWSFN